MQEQLKEIEGTLARSSQRRNTILYKLAKQRSEAARLQSLGIKRLPTNPLQVNDTKVVRHVLFTLKQEIGDKIAKLRDRNLCSVRQNGEALVRERNDEVNKLLAKQYQWELRLATLTQRPCVQKLMRKLYFGCAKELPEARSKAASEGRADDDGISPSTDVQEYIREDDIDVHMTEDVDAELNEDQDQSSELHIVSNDNDADRYRSAIAYLASRECDTTLLATERECEHAHRAQYNKSLAERRNIPNEDLKYITSYIRDGKVQLPDEDTYLSNIVNRRRDMLKERLAQLKRGRD